MSSFTPKLIKVDNEFMCLLDNVWYHEDIIAYAKQHKYNIKFTCGNAGMATEILCKIQEAGFTLKFVRRKYTKDCSFEVFDTVYCYLKEINS